MKFKDMSNEKLLEEYNKYRNMVDGITKTGFIDTSHHLKRLDALRTELQRRDTIPSDIEIDEDDLDEEPNKPDYKAGFNILMEYWDSVPDEEKLNIHKKLTEVGL